MLMIDVEKLIKSVLVVANLIFVTYILIISFCNPIFVDDFCFLGKANSMGFFQSMSHWFTTWHGRFGPQFVINLVVTMFDKTGTTLPYLLIIICIFLGSVFLLLKKLLPGADKNLLILLSFSTLTTVLLTVFDVSTFFWISGSTVHFAGPTIALVGIYLLSKNNHNKASYVLNAFTFIYVGSSSEHFGAMTLAVLLFGVLWVFLAPQKLIPGFMERGRLAWIIAFASCFAAFLVMFLAPGNDVRRALFPESSIINAFIVSVDSFQFLVSQILIKAPYLLITLGLAMWLGSKYKSEKPNTFVLKVLSIVFLGTVIFCYGVTLPTAYAVSSIGPIRSLTYMSFVLTGVFGFLGFIIGSWTKIYERFIQPAALLLAVLLLINVGNKFYTYLPDTIQYAKAETERISFFEQVDLPKGDTLKISRLAEFPKSILQPSEISSDPSYWVNECICDAYDFDYLILID